MDDFADPRKRATRGRRARGRGRARGAAASRRLPVQRADELGNNADRYERSASSSDDLDDTGVDFEAVAGAAALHSDGAAQPRADLSLVAHFGQLDRVLRDVPLIVRLGSFAADVLGERLSCERFVQPFEPHVQPKRVLEALGDLGIDQSEEEGDGMGEDERDVGGAADVAEKDDFDEWLDTM